MKKEIKEDLLLNKLADIFRSLAAGKVLDLGCGEGNISQRLKSMGFDVTAADADRSRFRHGDSVPFYPCDLEKALPFPDGQYDYVLFAEVIEHLRNPFFVVREISRVLKEGGVLVISTPNILNLGSRMRFLFQGSFDFFREPILDYIPRNPGRIGEMHLVVWRYQELEYLLFENHLRVQTIHTDYFKPEPRMLSLFLLVPLKVRCYLRRKRSLRKGGLDYSRIDKIMFSPELLYGRHLILKARKT